MQHVTIEPMQVDRLDGLLPADRVTRFAELAVEARALTRGRVVWNVNATAHGGGVAEMLQTLLAYVRGVDVDTRWLVLTGNRSSSRSPSACTTCCTASPATADGWATPSRRSSQRLWQPISTR